MNKQELDYVVKKTRELMEAPTCCQELKDVAQAWLDAIGTDQEAEVTKKYFEELKEDIMPIDNLIAFASSDNGKQYFGEETASNIVVHGKEIKANGAKYCDCPACAVVEAILDKEDELLK